jgi:hypothetical protein
MVGSKSSSALPTKSKRASGLSSKSAGAGRRTAPTVALQAMLAQASLQSQHSLALSRRSSGRSLVSVGPGASIPGAALSHQASSRSVLGGQSFGLSRDPSRANVAESVHSVMKDVGVQDHLNENLEMDPEPGTNNLVATADAIPQEVEAGHRRRISVSVPIAKLLSSSPPGTLRGKKGRHGRNMSVTYRPCATSLLQKKRASSGADIEQDDVIKEALSETSMPPPLPSETSCDLSTVSTDEADGSMEPIEVLSAEKLSALPAPSKHVLQLDDSNMSLHVHDGCNCHCAIM